MERNLLFLLANQLGTALTNAYLYEKATADPLTSVYCRGYFFQCLQEDIHHAHAQSSPLSLLMLDIDFFKMVNDRYTHQSGDRILQQMGSLLKRFFGRDSIVGRYGGEEFVVLLYCDFAQAIEKANELRRKIEKHHFFIASQQTINITSSIGVSTLQVSDVSTLLVERADKALYLAKSKGRNCVVSESEIPKNAVATVLQ